MTRPAIEKILDQMTPRRGSVFVPFDDRDLNAGVAEFACHRSQYTPAEMALVNAYLKHAWNGMVWMRPYTGALHNSQLFTR